MFVVEFQTYKLQEISSFFTAILYYGLEEFTVICNLRAQVKYLELVRKYSSTRRTPGRELLLYFVCLLMNTCLHFFHVAMHLSITVRVDAQVISIGILICYRLNTVVLVS